MLIIKTTDEMKKYINTVREKGQTIGFVPTMGYLHQGHLSLIKEAKKQNSFVVVSIYVNPTQFGVNEDFDSYPRDLERDAALCEGAGVDIIFNPPNSEMYPNSYKTYVDVEDITNRLCGAKRPGHFRGVTTVVCKLFNIIKPHRAYFGQKDAQQVAVIQRMVKDLNMDVEIIPCPIVREADGLAMSSRNTYLSPKEREAALILNKSLKLAEESVRKGETKASVIAELITKNINSEPLANIDYVEITDALSLEAIDELKGNILIALAVKFGKTRLIDNIRMEV